MDMKKWLVWGLGLVCIALAVLLCSANVTMGQEVTATITGTATDPSGAAIAGAKVTAKSVERGITYTAETNESGLYRISQLPVGSYELKVEKTGFASVAYPAFVVTLNQVARIDVTLKVGQVSQTIEVTSAVPVLKTESTQVDTIIDAATNDNLPLASRNYVQLTLLAPGSVSTDPSSFSSGNNTGGYGARPLISGNREQANNFLLDGMDNNQVSDNLLGYTPSPDAIEEFNLITNNAPAEFGNFMGGIVSAAIKSGTNSFHGDVWEFFRNDKLNANSWFNNHHDLAKPKLRWDMFGGTVGGPIKKNKLFFFFDYQGQRFDHPASPSTFNVFSAKERTGDFSELCQTGFTGPGGTCAPDAAGSNLPHLQLYNPCNPGTGVPGVPCTAAASRTLFAGNIIPLNMIDPVASALFASPLYPTPPSSAGIQNNAVNTAATPFNSHQYDIKVDYNITEKDRLYARYSHAYQSNPTTNSFALFGIGYSQAPITNDVVNWTHVFKPSLLNEFRFGTNYIHLNNGTTFDAKVGNLGEQLGMAGTNGAQLD